MRRRTFLLATLGTAFAAGALRAGAANPRVTVYKNPSCGCCGSWVELMRDSGFDVLVVDLADVTPQRRRLGVPDALASCHTAEVGGYALEGHVPAADVYRLLRERPAALGLAVPGMVPGSPGMTGAPVSYDTLLFRSGGGYRVFARH